MTIVALALLVLLVAFANGSNDNFKGVAALHGGGVLSYRAALAWGTLPTLLGSLAAPWLAAGLVRAFSGAGMIGGEPGHLTPVAAGAALTVFLATRLGLPVSTTHALAGALAGAGIASGGSAALGALVKPILLPLLVSPVAALALAALLQRVLGRSALLRGKGHCLCVVESLPAAGPLGAAQPVLMMAARERCEPLGDPVLSVDPAGLGRRVQIAAGAALGFARGLNDTPKIAALLVGAGAVGLGAGMTGIGLAMAAGGLLAAGRVAKTLSFGITPLEPPDGLAATLVAAALVLVASPLALPVSTTHVTCGALFGVGVARGEVRWGTVRTIALAWLTTFPAAAALAAGAGWLLV